MVRTIVYIVVLAILVAIASWFADQPGGVTVEWLGYKLQTENVGVLAALVLAFAVLCALAYRMWLAVRRAPRSFLGSRRAARREKGYRALTQGMVAVAAGDAAEAQRQARRADQLLEDPPLTMLLSAQAAQLDGDEEAAKRYFTTMLNDPETAFLGLRGLLMQAQRDGDARAALGYAQRAYELRPRTPWVLTTLFDLQVADRRWPRALATLDDAIRYRAVTAEDARMRRLMVLLGCSAEAEQAGETREALSHARKAHDIAPDFTPAVLALVRLMIAAGKTRPAVRLIHKAWGRAPHPELARLYGDIGSGEGALRKVRRMERLLPFNPDHPESHIAIAGAALEAGLWGIARSHLEKAAGPSPPARVCRLMAELEEAEHGDVAAARSWLLKAAGADPDPAWLCDDCGAVWTAWSPLCGKCGSLGSLGWETPERARGLIEPRPAPGALAAPAGEHAAAEHAVGDQGDRKPAPAPAPGADGGGEPTAAAEQEPRRLAAPPTAAPPTETAPSRPPGNAAPRAARH